MSSRESVEDFKCEDEATTRTLEQPFIPDYKSEFDNAKAFLQRCSPYTGDNLYDHLSSVLDKILAERPENIVDFFEEYSRQVKEKRFRAMTLHLKNMFVPPLRFEYTMNLMPLLKIPSVSEGEPSTVDPEDEDPTDPQRRNLMLLLSHLQDVGLGFNKTELFCLQISMRKLIKQEKLQDIRFWGQIFGLRKNYLIVETELSEEEIERRNAEVLEAEGEAEAEDFADMLEEKLAAITEEQERLGEDGLPLPRSKIPRPLPPVPKSDYRPPPKTPPELCGEGVNKKVYYASNGPGDEWVQLPDVTPQQIVAARQIKKNFTGNLDEPIITYPEFPGTERNYLRAQIARISAGTQISPLGFFTFKGAGGGEEEEEEEELEEEEGGGAMKTTYKINHRYEPHPMSDLTDISMSFWVHHTLYILPQGRTRWWNPYPKAGGEEEAAGEEEEEEGGPREVAEPETGPPLLTPLSEDASLEATLPWSVRISTTYMPEHAVAIVRSNLWPGAYALSAGKMFENIYIGWGHKHFAYNFSPTPLPQIQQEYMIGPEVMEINDPTGAQEEEWRIAHLPKPKPMKGEGEEELEEEEEEEEEDDDE